jgi:hypothetical protein
MNWINKGKNKPRGSVIGKENVIVVPAEFDDILKVLEMGAKKYGANSWLEGMHFNHKDNHASMSRHLAEAYMDVREDHESGLDPLLHLATRALMEYTMRKRGKL